MLGFCSGVRRFSVKSLSENPVSLVKQPADTRATRGRQRVLRKSCKSYMCPRTGPSQGNGPGSKNEQTPVLPRRPDGGLSHFKESTSRFRTPKLRLQTSVVGERRGTSAPDREPHVPELHADLHRRPLPNRLNRAQPRVDQPRIDPPRTHLSGIDLAIFHGCGGSQDRATDGGLSPPGRLPLPLRTIVIRSGHDQAVFGTKPPFRGIAGAG